MSRRKRCPKCRRPVETVQEHVHVTVTHYRDDPDLKPIEESATLRFFGLCKCGHEWRLRNLTDPRDAFAA